MFDTPEDPSEVEESEREHAVRGDLAASTRLLVDAVIRSTVAEAELVAVRAEIDQLVARLQASQMDGSYGVNRSGSGTVRAQGNAVIGLRNAVAPPLVITQEPEGRAWAEFHLGAAYEGPPGLVHGGVSALILDQLAGEAAAAGGSPGMTGTLTVRYRRGTPLGDLRGECWIEKVDGVKTTVKGHLQDAEGVTVEAEGIFILPRWARVDGERPERFE
ncbi:PaaI family thioesterase [Nocardioides sp. Bht2]|uniref:PaaI family thioesterase n=1 Tax=Nocardioides sp. Bht2 TaxID=3392297 RepID=UPI0039B435E8